MDCARNIITANFSGGGTSATTAPLWQWDYGQVLCITGIEDLPAAFEVHFSTNRTGGVSTVVVGADGQVAIPNILLTIGKNLNAWIYLSDAQGEGETEYSILIPVRARPMPETYDAEVSGEFDDVVRQVGEYAQTAQTAADNAGASASAAAASADSAAASASAAESAKTAAETAQGKAEDAQAAAETAAQTATQKAQQTAQDADQAAQSASDAESAAQRAEAAQTAAESAKTGAETAAQDAAASASTATEKANLAGQAASAAAQSATAAAQSAASIEGDVQTATQKAAEATAAADQAVAAKDAAVTAQQGAETAETNAGQSASTATTKAAEAAQSASSAAQSKTDAEAAATRAEQAAATLTIDSALSDTSVNPVQNKVITGAVAQVKSAIDALKITDTASGAIASFSDGAAMPVESLTVEMNPIQDLHGQDAPYPAGGGKNKLNVDAISSTNGIIVSNGSLVVTASSGRDNVTSVELLSDFADLVVGQQYILTFTTTYSGGNYIYLRGTNEVWTTGETKTITQAMLDGKVSFYSGVGETATISSLMIRPSSVSDATYSPYSNICPITGRDSVKVTRTGINVWDEEWELGKLNSNGEEVASASAIRMKNYLQVQPGDRYYAYSGSNKFAYGFFYDKNKTKVGSSNNRNNIFTVPANAYYYRFSMGSEYGATYNHDISINHPSTATAYEPYDGTSVTVQLGTTVYGGTVDVTGGELANGGVLEIITAVDGKITSEHYYKSTQNVDVLENCTRIALVRRSASDGLDTYSNDFAIKMCNSLPHIFSYANDTPHWYINNQIYIYLPVSIGTTYEEIAAYIAEHPIQIYIPYVTPTTLTTEPTTLSTLKGDNTVWSDGDSVDVTYIADPKLYIDKKITAAVAALA